MKIPNIEAYAGWCNAVVDELHKLGVPKEQSRDDIESDPDFYKESFEDGMLPNQAAKFACDHLL